MFHTIHFGINGKPHKKLAVGYFDESNQNLEFTQNGVLPFSELTSMPVCMALKGTKQRDF